MFKEATRKLQQQHRIEAVVVRALRN